MRQTHTDVCPRHKAAPVSAKETRSCACICLPCWSGDCWANKPCSRLSVIQIGWFQIPVKIQTKFQNSFCLHHAKTSAQFKQLCAQFKGICWENNFELSGDDCIPCSICKLSVHLVALHVLDVVTQKENLGQETVWSHSARHEMIQPKATGPAEQHNTQQHTQEKKSELSLDKSPQAVLPEGCKPEISRID